MSNIFDYGKTWVCVLDFLKPRKIGLEPDNLLEFKEKIRALVRIF